MRGEHVADLGPRGLKESCSTRSLAVGAGLRLVRNHGHPPSPHVFCRMAAGPGSHDPRWTAAVPFGTGRHAPIAAEDQARVIAGILENPTAHRSHVYLLFGPVQFTYAEIAQLLSRVLKKEVQYKQVSIDTMLQLMASGGQKPPAGHNARTLYGAFESTLEPRGDSFVIQHLREVAIDHQNGIFAGTNDLVEKIGGRPPMTLEEFINKHRAAFAA